jgi:DNA repair protein RadC
MTTQSRVDYLPADQRPIQRVIRDADACSLIELLAALIGGPKQLEIAEQLLARFGDLAKLCQATPAEIVRVHGIGESTAARLYAALALSRHMLAPPEAYPKVGNPKDVLQIVRPRLAYREQEYMLVLVLNTRNQVLDVVEVYHGSINGIQIRVGELFTPALRRNAAAIILAHNHPTGDPQPSPDDIAITKAVVEAGELLDVQVLDHLIVGHGQRCVSLKEQNLGF